MQVAQHPFSAYLFPPSSSVSGVMCSAAALITIRPTDVQPVYTM